jgi:hypothetical protein
MNRKLHNSLMALSSTGLLLVLGLMVATPVETTRDTPPTATAAEVPADAARLRRAEVRAAAMEARARAFEADVAAAADAGEALTLTAAFVAEAATAAAMAAAFDELPAAGAAPEATAPRRGTPRRSARSSLALPYFSFARGLRRGNGG